MTRRRIFLMIGLLVLLLIGLVAYGLTKTWDSPELGRKVLAHVGSLGGMEIEAEEFRLSLLEGLRLGKVHAEAQLPMGRMVLDADTIVLEHRLAPLLKRQIHVERVLFERPRLVLEEAPAPVSEPVPDEAPGDTTDQGSSAEAATSESDGFSAQVREVVLADATLESRPADPAALPTVVEGFDLTLRDLQLDDTQTLMTSVRGSGELRVRRIDAAGTQVTDAEGMLSLGDGLLQVQDLQFAVVDGGQMTVPRFELQLDHEDMLFDMELRGALDVEGLLGVGDTLIGGADLVFEGQGPLNDILSVAGNGRVEIQEGKLPAAKLFRLIDGVLGDSVLVGAEYDLFDIVYRLQDQRVKLDAFDIGIRDIGLTIQGEAGLDGTVSAKLDVRVPRERISIEDIPEQVLDILQDADGRVSLPFQIGGTSVDPDVTLTRAALLAAARQGTEREVKKRIEEEAGKALRRLFSRKKGDG